MDQQQQQQPSPSWPEKPNVLVLGACGFVGRHLIEYLVTNQLAAHIRAVDKTPPQMAWMSARHAALYVDATPSGDDDDPDGRAHFYSANLMDSVASSCAFEHSHFNGEHRRPWHLVVNCAAETRSGLDAAIHRQGTLELSTNCARLASQHAPIGCRYVELSSGNMNSRSTGRRAPDTEEACCAFGKPWTMEARYKLLVEEMLREQESWAELEWTVVRLPLVYGCGDRRGLTPRITIAAIYKYLGVPMKLLWNADLRLNTVHVADAVAAIWHLARQPQAVRQVYNVVDDSKSTQGTLSAILAEIFGIRVEYVGTFLSTVAKVNIFDTLDEINDKHMSPWAQLCANNGIVNTPLTPYMDEEQLDDKHLHLDNAKLKATGFQFAHPLVTRELVRQVVDEFVAMRLMPAMLD